MTLAGTSCLARMLQATLERSPDRQLTTMFLTPLSYYTLVSSSGRGISRADWTTPVDSYSGLLLTSRCWCASFDSLRCCNLRMTGLTNSSLSSAISKAAQPLILKQPILKNLLMMSVSLPFSVTITISSSGAMKFEMKLTMGPLLGSQQLPRTIPQPQSILVSTTFMECLSFRNQAELNGTWALLNESSQEVAPFWLSPASWKKYFGGFGRLEPIAFTNSSLDWNLNPQLVLVCAPIVQQFPAPIDLPQADPEPWPGYTLTAASNFFTFWIESYSMPAKSATVIFYPQARSGLPTSPRKTVSPENRATPLLAESMSWKHELSRVCPGVCKTSILTFPKVSTSPSTHSLTLKVLTCLAAVGPITTGTLNSVWPDKQSA